MRALVLCLLVAAPAGAQTPGIDAAVQERLATLRYIESLRDPATGAYRVTPDGKPSLRACNGAVKAVGCLGGKLADKEKVAAFVLGCYDPATGGFAEPGGKPDVAITSVGVMVAVELGIPNEKFRGAMGYLKANAKTFEEVRIAAAAVEAWGVKECGFDLGPWFDTAAGHIKLARAAVDSTLPSARECGGAAALFLRLGRPVPDSDMVLSAIRGGQLSDGGWGKGDKSDQETTYRVMRAFYLLKEKPKDAAAVRAFVAKCRNADGGYGVTPGEKSSMSGVYYAAMIGKWLDGMK